MDAIVAWLDGFGTTAFRMSAGLLLALNAFGAGMIWWTRDRAVVNRWTARFLAANLVLLGTGVGALLLTTVARSTLQAFAPNVRAVLPQMAKDGAEVR
jgi:hypothetical protein